jgi:hypothetical protein
MDGSSKQIRPEKMEENIRSLCTFFEDSDNLPPDQNLRLGTHPDLLAHSPSSNARQGNTIVIHIAISYGFIRECTTCQRIFYVPCDRMTGTRLPLFSAPRLSVSPGRGPMAA